MTLPPAPSQEGEMVAGLRMKRSIQTFLPRRAAWKKQLDAYRKRLAEERKVR